MSTRLTVDLIFLALAGAVAGWAARAPADPPARAAYLCGPVVAATHFFGALHAAVVEEGNTVAPTAAWQPDPSRACMRLVIHLNENRAY